MIDEKKLIEVLEKQQINEDTQSLKWLEMKEAGLHVKYMHGAYCYCNAIHIVNSQPKVGEWIPVEERYPDNDLYVLLSFKNMSGVEIGRYEEDEDGGAFYLGDEDQSCSSQYIFVNAWMPLPEPYKECDKSESL